MAKINYKKISTMSLNKKAEKSLDILIEESEKILNAEFLRCFKSIEKSEKQIIFVAGAEYSGKHSFCDLLKQELTESGKIVVLVSLNDFLISSTKKRDDIIDYDSPDAIDFETFKLNFNQLLINKKANFPIFNSNTKKRESEKFNRIELSPKTIVIVYGHHALNKNLFDLLILKKSYRIMLNNNTVFTSSKNLLDASAVRIFRGIIQNNLIINNAEEIEKMIDNDFELFNSYILPCFENANCCLNLSLNYESSIFKKYLLSSLLNFEGDNKIKPLIEVLKNTQFEVNFDNIPKSSWWLTFVNLKNKKKKTK